MRARYAHVAVALLLAAGLAALAAACTGSPGDAPPAATPTAPPAAPTATPTATPTPKPALTPSATPTAAPTPAPTPSATPAAPTPTPATATPTPAPKRYNRLDATGEAATAGSWAILGADGGVLTDWEDLRADAATLRLHQTDAGGVSQAAAYRGVEAGDLIEWRKADDCWVRYRVTGAPTRPATGSSRWEFPVEWMTYAATGAGCTGAVGAATVFRVDEDAPSAIPASGIASPVRHGPWLLIPTDWSGRREAVGKGGDPLLATGSTVEARVVVPSPTQGEAGGASGASGASTSPARVETSDLAEARRLIPLWRDPVLPTGWRFSWAEMGTPDSSDRGYAAQYVNARGYPAVEIHVFRPRHSPFYKWAVRGGDGAVVSEARTIDGHAALVRYSPPGPNHSRYISTKVQIFDEDAGIVYWLLGDDPGLLGSNIDPAIAIARSLYRAPSP